MAIRVLSHYSKHAIRLQREGLFFLELKASKFQVKTLIESSTIAVIYECHDNIFCAVSDSLAIGESVHLYRSVVLIKLCVYFGLITCLIVSGSYSGNLWEDCIFFVLLNYEIAF